jgi:hypothetical protein
MGLDDCFSEHNAGECPKKPGKCIWHEDCRLSISTMPTKLNKVRGGDVP